jgi:hypothetical protein
MNSVEINTIEKVDVAVDHFELNIKDSPLMIPIVRRTPKKDRSPTFKSRLPSNFLKQPLN